MAELARELLLCTAESEHSPCEVSVSVSCDFNDETDVSPEKDDSPVVSGNAFEAAALVQVGSSSTENRSCRAGLCGERVSYFEWGIGGI